jgi:hypothetical protein
MGLAAPTQKPQTNAQTHLNKKENEINKKKKKIEEKVFLRIHFLV